MKIYNSQSKQYEICEQLVESGAERIAEELAKAPTAAIQQIAIDTMHAIIARNPQKYMLTSRGTSLAAQIRQEQRTKIEQWGDKAYTLSEKQIAVIARELEQLAAVKAL